MRRTSLPSKSVRLVSLDKIPAPSLRKCQGSNRKWTQGREATDMGTDTLLPSSSHAGTVSRLVGSWWKVILQTLGVPASLGSDGEAPSSVATLLTPSDEIPAAEQQSPCLRATHLGGPRSSEGAAEDVVDRSVQRGKTGSSPKACAA